jgi:hypothetical protein
MSPTEKLLEFVMNTFVNLDKLYLKPYTRRRQYALSRKKIYVALITINNIAEVLTSYFQTRINFDHIFEIGRSPGTHNIPKMCMNNFKF